ncbi:hypothetical protein EE612_013016 [Oryza sativa]|nr:hypothetical protein EE612_013016 [Oryza sativa]
MRRSPPRSTLPSSSPARSTVPSLSPRRTLSCTLFQDP